MVEKFSSQVESIETHENNKIDMSLFRKRSNAKTFEGYLISKMKQAREGENLELVQLIQHFYKKHQEYLESERVRLENWRGKSSFGVIVKPDKFIVVTYQKPSKDEFPKEIRRDVHRNEVNYVWSIINQHSTGELIKTRDIAEKVYNKRWALIFSDRYQHTQLNYILRLLDLWGAIHYSGGKTTILNKKFDMQTIL